MSFDLKKKPNNLYTAEFKPAAIGKYRVDFETAEGPLLNSPCFIDVYDVDKVLISAIPNNLVIGSENIIKGRHRIELVKYLK